MKSAHDPRHQRRRDAIKDLFAVSFAPQTSGELANLVMADVTALDAQIAAAAPAWPIDKLNRIDLAILRLAVYELGKGETPPKVVIDEAVELAKEYGSESSPSFINGVLGTILKTVSEQKTETNEG